jgi:hypothetical protein
VVWLLLLSYPVLLTMARRPIAAYAADRGPGWRLANAVGGGAGVAGLLLATTPLRSLGLLLSVPLVTAWVTLGCPWLLHHLAPGVAPPRAVDGGTRRAVGRERPAAGAGPHVLPP